MTTHPRRLHLDEYVGRNRYSLTLCTHQRRRYFTDTDVVRLVTLQILQRSKTDGLAVIAYCLMPDHVHVVAEGLWANANVERFVRLSKQRAGYLFARSRGERLWQDSYFDRTLREDESLVEVVRYTINNPVRAGLAEAPVAYPHWGFGVCSREELLEFIACEHPLD